MKSIPIETTTLIESYLKDLSPEASDALRKQAFEIANVRVAHGWSGPSANYTVNRYGDSAIVGEVLGRKLLGAEEEALELCIRAILDAQG